MGRRRKYELNISRLHISKELKREIENLFFHQKIDLDINSFRLIAYESYTPTIRIDLDAVINRLKRYIYINGDQTLTKSTLLKVIKISRPTADRLMRLGVFEADGWDKYGGQYNLANVLKSIEEYQKKAQK